MKAIQQFADRRKRERRAEALEAWHMLGRLAHRRAADRAAILNARQADWYARYHAARVTSLNATLDRKEIGQAENSFGENPIQNIFPVIR